VLLRRVRPGVLRTLCDQGRRVGEKQADERQANGCARQAWNFIASARDLVSASGAA
jgi:hypothetical protein